MNATRIQRSTPFDPDLLELLVTGSVLIICVISTITGFAEKNLLPLCVLLLGIGILIVFIKNAETWHRRTWYTPAKRCLQTIVVIATIASHFCLLQVQRGSYRVIEHDAGQVDIRYASGATLTWFNPFTETVFFYDDTVRTSKGCAAITRDGRHIQAAVRGSFKILSEDAAIIAHRVAGSQENLSSNAGDALCAAFVEVIKAYPIEKMPSDLFLGSQMQYTNATAARSWGLEPNGKFTVQDMVPHVLGRSRDR